MSDLSGFGVVAGGCEWLRQVRFKVMGWLQMVKVGNEWVEVDPLILVSQQAVCQGLSYDSLKMHVYKKAGAKHKD